MIPATVIVLGFVSFFTDVSGEMIYPLIPIFLSAALHATPLALGVVEGVAETTASILKMYSGVWADRARRRKPLIVFGYGLSGLAKPLIGFARHWEFVLFTRFMDRVGKGLRASPRDALIADVTAAEIRGRAYGYHQAMDHAGAVLGPLIAASMLGMAHSSMRKVFFLAGIPALLAWLTLVFGVREKSQDRGVAGGKAFSMGALAAKWSEMSPGFKLLMLALLLFTLGNSTDAFLLMQLSRVGISTAWVMILWALLHVVKMVFNYFGGRASDRIGRKPLIVAGWAYYAVIYLLFAVVRSPTALITTFLAYGVYYGLTEPTEKAWVADLVGKELRGTAFGYYNLVIGIGALPASLLFGVIANAWGIGAAFGAGAVFAALATSLIIGLRPGCPGCPV